mmetsp:Transcript_27163/g.69135  ORF Transcript_27163/g.69135 Transcript_27163/m.69135 type:complete len:511 (+) Transcript_27163:2798-4330(+)
MHARDEGGRVAAGRQRAVEQLAAGVVLEQLPARARLVGQAAAHGPAAQHGKRAQQLRGRGRRACGQVRGRGRQAHAVRLLRLQPPHALRQCLHGCAHVGEPVNGDDTRHHHLRLAARKLGHHQTRAVAQAQRGADVERLEVLGLAGRGRHRGLLGAKQRVDGGRLADVGVAHQAHHDAPVELLRAWVVRPRFRHRLPRLLLQQLNELLSAQHAHALRVVAAALLPRAAGAAVALLRARRRLGDALQPPPARHLLPQLVPVLAALGGLRLERGLILLHSVRRPERVAHAGLLKVVGPLPAHGLGQQVGLVEQQQRVLGGVQLVRVRLQVLTPVQQRVARVHHLHHDVRPLQHAPQLPPHLQVLLKRRQAQPLALLDGGQLAPPDDKPGALLRVQLVGRRGLVPRRAARQLEAVPVALLGGGALLRRALLRQRVHHAGGHHDDLRALRGEVAVRHVRHGHELLKVIALQHRLDAWLGWVQVGGVLPGNHLACLNVNFYSVHQRTARLNAGLA